VEADVDGADDALDRGLDGVDAGAERADVVFGKAVQRREAHRGLRRRHLDEVEVPQLRGPLRRHLLLHHHLPLLLKRKRTPTQIQISTNQIGANSAFASVESRGGERGERFRLPLGAGGWAPPSHGIGRGVFSKLWRELMRRFFPLPSANEGTERKAREWRLYRRGPVLPAVGCGSAF
jgi:hypothetical protein